MKKEEFKTEKTYDCAICGKSYKSIEDRMNCERDCFTKLTERKNQEEEKKKREEQQKRKEEVDKAHERYITLKTKYVQDYGYYSRGLDNFDELFRLLP